MPIVLTFVFSRVAPNPNLDESQVIFVGNFGSKNFRGMFSSTMDLSLSNWFLVNWVTVKSQMDVLLMDGFVQTVVE